MSEDSLWSDYKDEYNPGSEDESKQERKQLNITILSVEIKTVPTTKGSYQSADVAYKNNTFQGKVEGKKVMSFGATSASFKTLATAVQGDIFEVEVVKNAAGYNDWITLTKATQAATAETAPQGASNASKAPVKSTYETPEERAAKQVYIVRQSSLNQSVSTLAVGAKSPPKREDVVELAKYYESYVFGTLGSGFEDMKSDFPDVN
jgi:hypothetical protein